MTRDLDTLLREAVATTPVDTDAVLGRARTIRRRRTAGRAVAALAVLAVLGTGLTLALDDEPVAPIVGTDPVDVEGALAPVLEATVVDPSLPLLRVDVDVDDAAQVPDVGARPADGETVPTVLAVGPDGTWVGTRGRRLLVGTPGGTTTTHAASHVATAAVLPDGDVLAALAASPGAPIDRVLHVRDGEATAAVLATPLPRSQVGSATLVQETDRVAIAVPGATGAWQELEMWNASDGVVTDAELVAVPTETGDSWEFDASVAHAGARTAVGRDDGLVVEIGRSDRSDAANTGAWSEHVIAGRSALGLGWLDVEADPVSVVAVLGPGDAAAVVPVRLPPAAEGWSEVAEPLLSVDGALWLRSRDGSGPVRIVPAGGLPGPTEVTGRPAPLPAAPAPAAEPRAVGSHPGVTVVPAGELGVGPTAPVAGRTLHDDVPAGCCWEPATIAPDGTVALVGERRGAASWGGGVQVVTPDGTATDVRVRALYGDFHRTGHGLAFDASGNLWGLANRWWSTAAFPDLVVRRPGEDRFTSVGHLPLDDLLGTDAGRVVFEVVGDEVALVGTTTDAAGRSVLAGRVVVVVDGQPLSADERRAESLPGVTTATAGGWPTHVGTIGSAEETFVSGPWLGGTMPGGVLVDTEFMGWPHRQDLVGGVVVGVDTGGDEGTDDTLVALGDRSGRTAVARVAGSARPLAAADGSVWAVVDETRVVQLLTSDWRPAG